MIFYIQKFHYLTKIFYQYKFIIIIKLSQTIENHRTPIQKKR